MISRQYLEDAESMALMQWCRTQPMVRDAIYHIGNGGRRLIREATRLKKMGVRAGVSDYSLPIPRGQYHGLWIELKSGKGRATAEQLAWIDLMRKHGHRAEVCTGWIAAKDLITEYMRLGDYRENAND